MARLPPMNFPPRCTILILLYILPLKSGFPVQKEKDCITYMYRPECWRHETESQLKLSLCWAWLVLLVAKRRMVNFWTLASQKGWAALSTSVLALCCQCMLCLCHCRCTAEKAQLQWCVQNTAHVCNRPTPFLKCISQLYFSMYFLTVFSNCIS